MKDFLNIGSVPYNEDVECDVNHPLSEQKAECQKFIDKIREICGYEPEGAKLTIKSFDHDFGTYCEVVCIYDTDQPDSYEYALHVESHAPATWDQEDKNIFSPED